jgi:hypothetical protein
MTVDATWVKCIDAPRRIGEKEARLEDRNYTCVQCEFSPVSAKEDIVPLTVSLLGDFTDIKNSVPFRYYKEVRFPLFSLLYTGSIQGTVQKTEELSLRSLERTF